MTWNSTKRCLSFSIMLSFLGTNLLNQSCLGKDVSNSTALEDTRKYILFFQESVGGSFEIYTIDSKIYKGRLLKIKADSLVLKENEKGQLNTIGIRDIKKIKTVSSLNLKGLLKDVVILATTAGLSLLFIRFAVVPNLTD